jgi:DNA-binding response OmpR family regulator
MDGARNERIQLATAEVLLACGDPDALEVLSQMFAGFGVYTPRRCFSADEARTVLAEREINLLIVDSMLADMEGHQFIHELRHSRRAPNCYTPAILVLGHTTPSQIFRGRDAGANFVVRKPVAPQVMLQRIVWLLNDQRKFVTSEGYCGPDRRVRAVGPPAGIKGRRHDDLSVELGMATTPNLDQNEIDALFSPKALAR